MSESTPARFFERLNEDKDLAKEYQTAVADAVRSSVWPAIVEVARKDGLEFSAEELGSWLTAQGRKEPGELTDEALGGITGGAVYSPSLTYLGFVALGGLVWAAPRDDDDEDDDQEPPPLSP